MGETTQAAGDGQSNADAASAAAATAAASAAGADGGAGAAAGVDAAKGADTKGAGGAEKGTAKSAVAAAGEESKGAAADVELKLPEGFKADDKDIAEFKALAKAQGLDSPKAQALFDHFASRELARAKADAAAFEAQDDKWAKEIRADKDIGGNNWTASTQAMSRALNKFGGRPLAELIDRAGLGNHPVLVKALVGIGRALGEDSVAGAASASAAADKSEEAILRKQYPTMFKDKDS
jgi:hypothetical protein